MEEETTIETRLSKAELSAVAKAKMLQMELESLFVNREEHIRGLLIALVSRQNVLMVGPPGCGKTLLADKFAGALALNYFSTEMSNFSTPEQIFGGLNMKKYMETGKQCRDTEGYLPWCEIALLDEIARASESVLDSMLKALDNSRQFRDGGKTVKIPLMTAIGAANHWIEGDHLDALDDRFVLRFGVQEVVDTDLRRQIRKRRKKMTVSTSLTWVEIADLQAACENVVVPEALHDMIDVVEAALMEKIGRVPSSRRMNAAMDAMCASAVLDGRAVAEPEDLLVMEHILWRKQEDEAAVRKTVVECVFADRAKAEQLYGEWLVDFEEIVAANKGMANVPTSAIEGLAQSINKIGEAVAQLDKKQTKSVVKKMRDQFQKLCVEKRRRESVIPTWMG